MDAPTDDAKETDGQQIERMAQKLGGLSKPALVREYLRYWLAKQGRLAHKMPPEFIKVSMKALRRVLADKYSVTDRELLKLLQTARKAVRPKPFI